MAKEKEELVGKALMTELSRYALRIGRKAESSAVKDKTNLILAIGLINHAQGLVEVDATKARRLMGQVKKLI